VAEQEREVVVDAALAVVEVGMAHPAGLDLDDRLARPGVGHHDRFHADRRALGASNNSLNMLRHGPRTYSNVEQLRKVPGTYRHVSRRDRITPA
jgi:hypothetical protein